MIGLVAAFLFGAGVARAAGLRGAFAVVVGAAFGLGAESATYAVALLSSGPRSILWFEAALALVGIALLARRRPAAERLDEDHAPMSLQVLFAVACTVAAAAFAAHAWRSPEGGWDAWMIWNLRARFFFRAQEGFRAAFSPAMVYLVHQDYPFLIPGLVAQGFALVGAETPLVPIGVAFLFGALLVGAVGSAGREILGSRRGMLAALAVVSIPCILFAGDQQSDVPLALYLFLAAALIELRRPLLAGFAAGLGAWTKNEGTLYAVLLAVALLWRWRDWRAAARFVAGASPALLLVAFYKLAVVPPTDLAALSTRASLIHNALDTRRWIELLWLLFRRIVFVQRFGLWLVAEVVVLFMLRRHRPGVVGTALLASCATFAILYLLQPFSLQWMVRNSVDRLILQMWPAAVLATLTALGQRRTTART